MVSPRRSRASPKRTMRKSPARTRASPKRSSKRSPRRSPKRTVARKGRLVKGSAEAKAYMAKIRAMKKTHKHHLKKHSHKKRSVKATSPRRTRRIRK